MLAAAQRLRRRGEFAATVRAGRRAGRGVVVVHLMLPGSAISSGSVVIPEPESARLPGAEQPSSLTEPARTEVRAGFVVPKSVGGAVLRNQVKRRLRHLMRDRLAGFPAGTDLVIRALPGAADRSYPELSADLDAALATARRRKPVHR